MEKRFLDRRLWQMEEEGVIFRPSVNVGADINATDLATEFDAVALCGGATWGRDLDVSGRDLKGVYFAMEYLPLQNKRGAGDHIPDEDFISAENKRVIILGGGDTGADCLGTVHRQKAASVHQFEIMPMPPADRAPQTPWPLWPMQLRIEGAHE